MMSAQATHIMLPTGPIVHPTSSVTSVWHFHFVRPLALVPVTVFSLIRLPEDCVGGSGAAQTCLLP